jgi:pilus assembly protein CpaF
MVSMAGVNFPTRALRAQIASAINIVMQIERQEDGRRRIVSLQEINGMESDVIVTSELFHFERHGLDPSGNVLGQLVATGIMPSFDKRLRDRGITLPARVFSQGRDDFPDTEVSRG